MKKLLKTFSDTSYWIDICGMYLLSALMVLLKAPWYLLLIYAVVAALITIFLLGKTVKGNPTMLALDKKMRSARKAMKKDGSASHIYKALEKELLPVARSYFPNKIYKYYQLGDDEKKNKQRIETIRDKSVWSSVYSQFNDPFECQFMYLTEEDLVEMGFPAESKKIWDSVMEQIRQRITTVCFTQNPNSMPMWAHYANEHKGFCVEYEIIDSSNLYPVFYAKNRIKAQGLFVELIYSLFCKDAKIDDRATALKYIMMMSAFKDESWEYEKEIRAIFMNSKADMKPTGRLCSCEELGVRPTKIFIGAKCSQDKTTELIALAREMGIEHEKCKVLTGDICSVVTN